MSYGRTEFLESGFVSRETNQIEQIDQYIEMLKVANEQFNLVGPSAIENIWQRHILDSAQLGEFVSRETNHMSHPVIMDIGSGAGFPAIILSILGAPHIHLIESTGKKAKFLQDVIDKLGLKATVHYKRSEDIKGLKADLLIGRAVAPLTKLLDMAAPLTKESTTCLFPKGQALEAELTEAMLHWHFEPELIPSRSDPSGTILLLRNVAHDGRPPSRKKPKPGRKGPGRKG